MFYRSHEVNEVFVFLCLAEECAEALVHARRTADKDAGNLFALQLILEDILKPADCDLAATEGRQFRAE